MFLSVILICTAEPICRYSFVPVPFTYSDCQAVTTEGIDMFKATGEYVVVEGRCFAWGDDA